MLLTVHNELMRRAGHLPNTINSRTLVAASIIAL